MKIILFILLLTLCVPVFGTNITVTPNTLDTNSSTALPNRVRRIAIGRDGFIRALVIDTLSNVSNLKFIRCLNASCTSKNTNIVYHSRNPHQAGDTGILYLLNLVDALSLGPSDDIPRIAMVEGDGSPGSHNTSALGYILCSDIDCNASTFVSFGGTVGTYSAFPGGLGIATNSSGTTYILYQTDVLHSGKQGIKIATCVGISCTPATSTVLADISDSGRTVGVSSLRLAPNGTPKAAYILSIGINPGTVHYWSNGTDTQLSSDGNFDNLIDIDVDSNGNGDISWSNFSETQFEFIHCTNSTCSTNSGITAFAIGQTGTAAPGPGTTSVFVAADGFSRLAFSYVGATQPYPGGTTTVQCMNDSCSSNITRFISVPSGQQPMIAQVSDMVTHTLAGVTTENILGVVAVGCSIPTCLPNGPTGGNAALLQISEVVKVQQPAIFVSRKLIDLIGLNPGVTIPVRSKDGKIPFSFSLIENPIAFVNNNQWNIVTQMAGVSSPPLVHYTPTYPAVTNPPTTVFLPPYTQAINDTQANPPAAKTIGTPPADNGWFFIDSSYVSHFFDVTGAVGNTITKDGSGYTLLASNTTALCKAGFGPCPVVTDTGGNVINNNDNIDTAFKGNVATFTDPNGVIIRAYFAGDAAQSVIYYDSMGLIVLTAAETNAGSVPPNGPLPTNQYTYSDSLGKAQRFIVAYAQFYQSTNFGCSGITEMPRTPVFLPIKVTLPDGSSYGIAYEPTLGHAGDVTGRISTVTIPTGGLTRYAYSGTNNGVNCADGSIPVLTTTTPDGGTWISTHVLN